MSERVRLLIQLIPEGQAVMLRVVKPRGRPRVRSLPLPIPRTRSPKRWFAWNLLEIARCLGAGPGDSLAVTDPDFARLVEEGLRLKASPPRNFLKQTGRFLRQG